MTTGLKASDRNLSAVCALMEAHKRRLLLGEPEPIQDIRFSNPEGKKGEKLPPAAVDHFLKFKESKHRDKPETARRVKVSLASARSYFGEMLVRDLNKAAIEDYMQWRRESNIKDVVLRKDLFALRMFSRYSIDRRWLAEDPTKDIEAPSDKDSLNSRTISDEEERIYLGTAEALPPLWDFAKISLLQGMRPSEILQLPIENIPLDDDLIRITEGKSEAAQRVLKIHADAKPIFARRIAQAKGPWLFPFLYLDGQGRIAKVDWSRPQSVDQMCNTRHNRACRLSGLDFVAYSLRHTFATRFYRQTKDIFNLKTILGHADIKTTLRYINDEEEQAFEAMQEFEKRVPVAPSAAAAIQ